MRRFKGVWAVLWLCLGAVCWGQNAARVTQQITLQKGWNAVWIGVTVEDLTPDEVFESWPVESVAAYPSGAEPILEQFSTSQSEVTPPTQSFYTWHRGNAVASTLKQVSGDMVYIMKASEARSDLSVTGRPLGRRMTWKTGYNYYGCSPLDGTSVTVSSILQGLPQAPKKYYMVYGTGSSPELVALRATDTVKRGDVIVLEMSEESAATRWSGAFSLSVTQGITFSTNAVLATLNITNTTGEACTFTLAHLGYDRSNKTHLALQIRDRKIAGWQEWKKPLSKELAADETWELELGLDRSALGNDPGAGLVDLLRCTAENKSKHSEELAIFANNISTRGGNWPEGVWAVAMSGTKVTFYEAGQAHEGIKVEKAMPLNLLLRAGKDATGNAIMELPQRLTVASLQNVEAGTQLIVYGPNATMDTQAMVSLRLSTPLLPPERPVIPLTGTFENTAKATWTVGATANSNPFRHPYHPDHDGLKADYSAPDVDYTAETLSVKSELWTVKHTLTLTWSDREDAQWAPEEMLSGTFAWSLEGLRAEGPITVAGPFTMRRIIVEPDYRAAEEK